MRYVVSDVHGNYNLLVKLLNKIKFSRQDTLYILGDVIDKGKDVQKLLDLIFNKIRNNVVILAGNHEYEFIKFVTNLIKNDASDEAILSKSKRFLEVDDITLDEIDEIIHLPYYYEEDDFILVHAGIQFDIRGNPIPLEQSAIETLVYDRRFKDENFLPPNCKCVIFGHTPTCYIGGGCKGKIIKYQKSNTIGDRPCDYYKVHIDTGNYLTGILGCLRLDDMQEFYISE